MKARLQGTRHFMIVIAAVLAFTGTIAGVIFIYGFGRYAAGEPHGLQWPLDIPRRLSGTLGETRGFSLHMGIDLKTDGLTGYPVHAAGEGVLSRLTSSPGGYGNAFFLLHNSGVTTVYAHLERFEENRYHLGALSALASVLYTPDPVNMRFNDTLFRFLKGEVIGYTGESGSGLPHFHYEVRGATGFINPLELFRVPDRQAPVIEALYLCVEKNGSTLWEQRVAVKKYRDRYVPEENPLVYPGGGRPFVKVSCYDRVNADNSVGIYRISLSNGNEPCFDMVFDETGFAEYRDGHRVYDLSRSGIDGTAAYTYRLRRDKGAPRWIRAPDSGFLRQDSPCRLKVWDHAGNCAGLEFTVTQGRDRISTDGFVAVSGVMKKATLAVPGGRFSMEMPPGAVEERCLVRVLNAGTGFVGALPDDHPLKKSGAAVIGAWKVEPFDMVYRKPVRVRITAPPPKGGVPRIFVYHWFPGKNPRPLWTRYDAGRGAYTAESRTNGYYLLAIDRGKPRIFLPPVHEFFSEDGGRLKLRIIAYDELSRLDSTSVRCFFDGEDIPARYDQDRRWIELVLPREPLAEGFHQLSVFCSDYAGNRNAFRTMVKL